MRTSMIAKLKPVAVAIAVATPLISGAMAQDIISAEFSGIAGDAKFATSYNLPADSIEILSLSSGVTNASTITAPEKAQFSGLQLLKHFGASSPQLFLTVATGQYLISGTINFYHVTNNTLTKYFTIDLAEVNIVGEHLAGSEANALARDAENLSITYRQIVLTDVLAGTSACWDIPRNSRC